MAHKEAIETYIKNISCFAPNQKANPVLLHILGVDESYLNSSNEFILNQYFAITSYSKTSNAVKRLEKIIENEDTPYYSALLVNDKTKTN